MTYEKRHRGEEGQGGLQLGRGVLGALLRHLLVVTLRGLFWKVNFVLVALAGVQPLQQQEWHRVT